MNSYVDMRRSPDPMDYVGDRYVPDEEFAQTSARILFDAHHDLPGFGMRITRRVRVGSRSLDVSVVRHPGDLSCTGAARSATEAVVDHAMRYGWDRSHYGTDLVERSFDVVVDIDASYWGRRQRAAAGLDAGRMTPSAFMKALRPGDVLRETNGPMSGRAYRVTSCSSGRFVTDDGLGGTARMSWQRPHAECLHVDGGMVRIATGTIRDPDSHSMLEWSRKS